MVGKFDNYLYAVFKVTDNTLIYRAKNSLSITNNDYLQIGLKTPDGQFNTYIIAPRQDGWVNAFDANTKAPFTKIQGYFESTESGYNVELRFPISMLGNKLGFAIVDIDSKEALLEPKIMSTSNLNNPSDLGSVLVPSPEINRIKSKLREHKLASVCEEANCPNLGECFSNGTATFMIMGEICTRRCPFCDVAHGRPNPLSADEPTELATAVADMALRYVVVTSVDRDDLRDGGAQHFADCIGAINERTPSTQVEVLVPDFRGRMDIALDTFKSTQPDVFNHNIETVPSLYLKVRPGSRYFSSLELLKNAKKVNKNIFTKSGIMVGLGESRDEILQVMDDLKAADVDFLTIGQYLQPSTKHYPLDRYYTPKEFEDLGTIAKAKGFLLVSSSPLTRSSYHADEDFAKLQQNRINQH